MMQSLRPPDACGRIAPNEGLRREIAIALVAKFLALIALYLLFFSPAHRHPADLAARIAGDPPSPVLPLSR